MYYVEMTQRVLGIPAGTWGWGVYDPNGRMLVGVTHPVKAETIVKELNKLYKKANKKKA